MTAEQVYTSAAAAMKDVQATRMRMELSFDMTVTEGAGDSAEVTEASMAMIVDTMASTDPFGNYVLMDISAQSGEETMDTVIEIYMLEEEGTVVSYMQMMGMWMRSDTGLSVKEFLASGEMTEVDTDEIWNSSAKPGEMTLDEETTTLNGAEVYVLRGTVPVDSMDSLFADLGIADTSAYKELTIPMTYYIDAKNFCILRVEAQMSFLKEIIAEALAQSMVGTDTEGVQLELDITDACYDLEYGVPEIPDVPQEAYDYLESQGEYEDPTVYDGPLVLNCGSEQLLITCPEGFVGEFYDETNIMISDEEFTVCGDYFFWEALTREEVMNLADIYAGYLEDAEMLVSQGEGPSIEGYETWAVIGEGESYYYAWREAGDGWLLVAVYDYTGIDNPNVLLPQFLSYISPYSE